MLISPNRHVWELSANHATPLSLAACLVSHQYSYNMWNLAQLTEGSSSLPSHCLKNLSAWGTCRISQPGEPVEPHSLRNLQNLSSQPGEPAAREPEILKTSNQFPSWTSPSVYFSLEPTLILSYNLFYFFVVLRIKSRNGNMLDRQALYARLYP